MDVQCPKCKTKFPVKAESQVAGGKARAKLWTFEERSAAMKKSWATRRAKARDEKEAATS